MKARLKGSPYKCAQSSRDLSREPFGVRRANLSHL